MHAWAVISQDNPIQNLGSRTAWPTSMSLQPTHSPCTGITNHTAMSPGVAVAKQAGQTAETSAATSPPTAENI